MRPLTVREMNCVSGGEIPYFVQVTIDYINSWNNGTSSEQPTPPEWWQNYSDPRWLQIIGWNNDPNSEYYQWFGGL